MFLNIFWEIIIEKGNLSRVEENRKQGNKSTIIIYLQFHLNKNPLLKVASEVRFHVCT